MFCLDTSVVVEILRGNMEVVDKLDVLLGESDTFVTSVTLCELYKGACGHAKVEEKMDAVEKFTESVYVLDLDKKFSKCFGDFWQHLRRKGNPIGDFDVLIASIVKANNLTLITRDKHFKKLGIKVVVV